MRFKMRFLFLPILLFTSLLAHTQTFLKADGTRIVDESGHEILLRGFGLGGWMLQEGYMLKVGNVDNQQHQIRARIEELIGPEKTQQFYDSWLANHTRKIDIDSMAAWGFNSVRLPMHYNLYTLPVDQEPVKGKDGNPQKKSLSECEKLEGSYQETCRELFINASNCKISPEEGTTVEACIAEKVGEWVDSNMTEE